MKAVQVAGRREKATSGDSETERHGSGLHPDLFDSNFDFPVVFVNANGHIAVEPGINIRIDIEFGFANRKAGASGADLATGLEPRDLVPAGIDIGISTDQYGADRRIE